MQLSYSTYVHGCLWVASQFMGAKGNGNKTSHSYEGNDSVLGFFSMTTAATSERRYAKVGKELNNALVFSKVLFKLFC